MAESISIDAIQLDVAATFGLDPDDIRVNAGLVADRISQNNKESASSIYESVLSGLPIRMVPDIEEVAFSDVVSDDRIRRRLIEKNLDSANKYLAQCLSLRNMYYETSKLYVDAALKSLEFWLLDEIHKLEVRARVYELPYDEAIAELRGAESSLEELNKQQKIYADLIASRGKNPPYQGLLSEKVIVSTADAEGTAAQIQEDNVAKADKLIAAHKEMANRRLRMETASWDFGVRSVAAISQDTRGRIGRLTRRVAFTEKDIKFRASRAEVSRNVAWLQLWEHSRNGSPLNYKERLDGIRQKFNQSAQLLILHTRALQDAPRDLYGIELEFSEPPRGGLVDGLWKWLTQMQEQIGIFHQRQRVANCRIEVPIIDSKSGAYNVTLEDTSGAMGVMRGVALEYFGSITTPISVSILPPVGGVPDQPAEILAGRVLPYGPGLELRPQYIEQTWNGRPYGDWRVALLGDLQPDSIRSVAIYIWLGV